MKREWFRAALVACIAASSATALAQEQLSPDDLRARTHFESGRSYFEEGAYDRALEEFQRAYDLSHRPALLINLATTNERLANYAEAIANIQAYLAAVPDDPSRVTLERRVENLQRLQAERGSSGPAEPAAPAEPGTAPPPSGGGPDGTMLAAGLGVLGGAAVAGVLMGVFGGLALSEDAELRNGCGATSSCTPADVADADTFALVSDVFLGVTIAAAAAGAALLIVAFTSGGGSSESATIVPWVTPDAGGASVLGRF